MDPGHRYLGLNANNGTTSLHIQHLDAVETNLNPQEKHDLAPSSPQNIPTPGLKRDCEYQEAASTAAVTSAGFNPSLAAVSCSLSLSPSPAAVDAPNNYTSLSHLSSAPSAEPYNRSSVLSPVTASFSRSSSASLDHTLRPQDRLSTPVSTEVKSPLAPKSAISTTEPTSQYPTLAVMTTTAAMTASTGMDSTRITANNIMDLPTEILEEILCHLSEPQNFVRACRQIYQLSQSPFLRAKYLLLLHGPDRVLTRKVVEQHRLTCSILTEHVVSRLVTMGTTFRDPEEFIFRWACSKGHVDLVCQLLESKPAIDLRFRSDWFLREAAKNGRTGVVKVLLQQEDYVPSENGLNKAFEAAYEQSDCDTVRALLDYAEARGALLEQGSSVFHSVTPSTRRAKRVMAGGLYIRKDADKALRYAVRGNDVAMVKLLMDYEADVHAFNEEPILVAAQKGHVEILNLLIQAGADIETKAGAPLRQAAEGGHIEAVRILCKNGADTMWGGCSALRTAASQGFADIIATLLDHDANVNIHEGTPLQLACQHGHEAAVRVLLRYGANHRLDDGAAYKLALEANHETIKALLVQAETAMRAKERELERIMQQQGGMRTMQQSWYPAHSRTFSDAHLGSAFNIANQYASTSSFSTATAMMSAAGRGGGAGSDGSLVSGSNGDIVSRGHKRYYSQMSNPLSVADLFRPGSICGLVALDDEIRARQRSENNRL